MRVGLIARANDRGLGSQTWEAFRGYPFDETLVVLTNERRWPEYPDRFPGAPTVLVQDGRLPEKPIRRWLERIDVLFSVETLYDWRLAEWARSAGVATVVQGNPEFYRHETYELGSPSPSIWTWPTSWRVQHLPPGPVLGVPVPDGRPRIAAPPTSEEFRVLHVAGHRALGDRNGTDLMMESLRYIKTRTSVRIIGQDGQLPERPRIPENVTVEETPAGVADRWEMYRDVNLVVLPRRYGGLSLPAQEALASGCAVAMSRTEPNEMWPNFPLDCSRGVALRAPCGQIPTHVVRPEVIARAIDHLNRNRHIVERLSREAEAWVARSTWSVMRPLYTALFEEALG